MFLSREACGSSPFPPPAAPPPFGFLRAALARGSRGTRTGPAAGPDWPRSGRGRGRRSGSMRPR